MLVMITVARLMMASGRGGEGKNAEKMDLGKKD
jgi:hypothetical protein